MQGKEAGPSWLRCGGLWRWARLGPQPRGRHRAPPTAQPAPHSPVALPLRPHWPPPDAPKPQFPSGRREADAPQGEPVAVAASALLRSGSSGGRGSPGCLAGRRVLKSIWEGSPARGSGGASEPPGGRGLSRDLSGAVPGLRGVRFPGASLPPPSPSCGAWCGAWPGLLPPTPRSRCVVKHPPALLRAHAPLSRGLACLARPFFSFSRHSLALSSRLERPDTISAHRNLPSFGLK